MAITRVIDWWQHNFGAGTATVHIVVTDSVEGTTVGKDITIPEAQLPAAIRTWEAAAAASRNATLATPPAPEVAP